MANNSDTHDIGDIGEFESGLLLLPPCPAHIVAPRDWMTIFDPQSRQTHVIPRHDSIPHYIGSWRGTCVCCTILEDMVYVHQAGDARKK